ncbi:hypothetical protein G9Q38_07050 [Pusillimonas sp. DMV24BSW_D]|uniref:hypothetical protein n=1 Tax=Neopusillimonas aestuarii TaxID=2716226 RepID=UPI00140E079E|nr:hypothetical protein [Pusillimonas sp. DMV24BSW_D]QIM47671.1 hypothetical protein G9Q38_07050 [Pusillimonas sp. DMV24BSW_D]
MICITDVNCKKHYLHKDAIARVNEAGPNWHRISAYVKLFDGGTIEACERAAEIHAQIERTQPAEPAKAPSFDDWFKERNSGLSFDEAHMGDGVLIDKSMKELSRHMRDYVTELVNAKP